MQEQIGTMTSRLQSSHMSPRHAKVARKDLYGVLNLKPGASELDIKAAYRQLARKWHPDKNPNDTQA